MQISLSGRLFFFFIGLVSCCVAQDSYDSLVAAARESVSANRLQDAANIGRRAMYADHYRWEAYVVVGTAESGLGHRDLALEAFRSGLPYAPADKRPAIQSLIDRETASSPAPQTATGADSLKMAEARSAITKFQDCKAAISALEGVSSAGKATPDYSLLMANAQECGNNTEAALRYYAAYNAIRQGDPAIVAKIGELSYMTKKQAAAEQAVAEQKAAAEKAAGERQIARPHAIQETAASLQRTLSLKQDPDSEPNVESNKVVVSECNVDGYLKLRRPVLRHGQKWRGEHVAVDLTSKATEIIRVDSNQGKLLVFDADRTRNADFMRIWVKFNSSTVRDEAYKSAKKLVELCQNP